MIYVAAHLTMVTLGWRTKVNRTTTTDNPNADCRGICRDSSSAVDVS